MCSFRSSFSFSFFFCELEFRAHTSIGRWRIAWRVLHTKVFLFFVLFSQLRKIE